MEPVLNLCRTATTHAENCAEHATCQPAFDFLDQHCTGPATDPAREPFNTVPAAIDLTPDTGPVHNGASELADLELFESANAQNLAAETWPVWDGGQLMLILALGGLLGFVFARFFAMPTIGQSLRPLMGLSLLMFPILAIIPLKWFMAAGVGLAWVLAPMMIGLGLLGWLSLGILREHLTGEETSS